MLKVNKKQVGETLEVEMIGPIEDDVDFSKLIGDPGPSMTVNTEKVLRINSQGIKAWLGYFQALEKAGVALTMTRMSPAIVQQGNQMFNFFCGAFIESMYVPLLCEDCDSTEEVLFTCEELIDKEFELPKTVCKKCQSENMILDDLPDEYFGFLMR